MEQLPAPITVTIVIALLAIFLMFITALKYMMHSNFERTRLVMTAFFCFIVATLSISFWHYTILTLPYTIPSASVGAALGYLFGVRTEQQKIHMHGIEHYMQHFAHVHVHDIRALTWWSVINFYSVMGGLLLINLIGLSTVIFYSSQTGVISTCVVGAFLLGTIIPYLIHLWSVTARNA